MAVTVKWPFRCCGGYWTSCHLMLCRPGLVRTQRHGRFSSHNPSQLSSIPDKSGGSGALGIGDKWKWPSEEAWPQHFSSNARAALSSYPHTDPKSNSFICWRSSVCFFFPKCSMRPVGIHFTLQSCLQHTIHIAFHTSASLHKWALLMSWPLSSGPIKLRLI